MLTRDDLQKIGDLIETRTRTIVREEIEIETSKIRAELTSQNLRTRVEFNEVKKSLKDVQIQIKKISKQE